MSSAEQDELGTGASMRRLDAIHLANARASLCNIGPNADTVMKSAAANDYLRQ